MSGVRVKDRELLELGMTLPGFVERSQVIASLPSLSLLTLASWTPQNWEVKYQEIDEIKPEPLEEIRAFAPDLVAISSFTARILDAYALADQLRAQGICVVLGGLHVSSLPDEAALHADAIVIGEGELAWPNLIRDFENKELRPRYDTRGSGRGFDLADAKVPSYHLLDVERYNRITLQTTRGCPLDCSFCAASRLISPYKKKPLQLVRKELEEIIKIWKRPFIELADDNSFVDKRWAKSIAELFLDYPLRWFTETDISVADDPKLLELLAKSGCVQMLIGFEAASLSALSHTDSRGWKAGQFEHYRSKIARIQSFGISVNGCFILGFDSDDKDCFLRTREFVHEAGLAEVQVTILTPFPGTELYAKLRREQRLLSDVFWDRCTLFDVVFRPAQMTSAELAEGFRWLMRELYTDERKRERRLFMKRAARARKEKGHASTS